MRVEMTPKEFLEYTEYLNHKSKRSREWLALQKEISNYCLSHKAWRRSFSTQQSFIYGAIKFVTGVNQMDSLKGDQADIARAVFCHLADWRKEFSNESD